MIDLISPWLHLNPKISLSESGLIITPGVIVEEVSGFPSFVIINLDFKHAKQSRIPEYKTFSVPSLE